MEGRSESACLAEFSQCDVVPVALIRPEVKITPDWRSAKTGSDLSAMETVRGDCDVRVSGLGVGVPVNWSPRVVPGCNVVCGDSTALCIRSGAC